MQSNENISNEIPVPLVDIDQQGAAVEHSSSMLAKFGGALMVGYGAVLDAVGVNAIVSLPEAMKKIGGGAVVACGAVLIVEGISLIRNKSSIVDIIADKAE